MYKVHSDFRKFICELNGKFYELPCRWLKIYEDNVLTRHFQACINEDNQIGYYEHVLGKFFLPEEPIKEVNMADIYKIYSPKDGVTYLDCNTQYIDTCFDPRKVQAIYIKQPDSDQAKKYVELTYKHGHWIDTTFENVKVCSLCGKSSSKVNIYGEAAFDYVTCPYCMTIMDGEDK